MPAKTKPDNETTVPAEPASAGYRHYHYKKSWLVPVLVVIIVILLVAGIFGWASNHRGRFGPAGGFGSVQARRGFAAGGLYGVGSGGNAANQNRLQGVVTAVNGSSFTLAGNGTTNTVQTNGSTQYQNGNAVAVNDTVIVFGSVSNSTFTASQVVINPAGRF